VPIHPKKSQKNVSTRKKKSRQNQKHFGRHVWTCVELLRRQGTGSQTLDFSVGCGERDAQKTPQTTLPNPPERSPKDKGERPSFRVVIFPEKSKKVKTL
jgi:hypothetical protein